MLLICNKESENAITPLLHKCVKGQLECSSHQILDKLYVFLCKCFVQLYKWIHICLSLYMHYIYLMYISLYIRYITYTLMYIS